MTCVRLHRGCSALRVDTSRTVCVCASARFCHPHKHVSVLFSTRRATAALPRPRFLPMFERRRDGGVGATHDAVRQCAAARSRCARASSGRRARLAATDDAIRASARLASDDDALQASADAAMQPERYKFSGFGGVVRWYLQRVISRLYRRLR